MLTGYFSSLSYDGETVINSLPKNKSVKIIDEWTEPLKTNPRRKVNHCVLFLERDAVDPIRYCVKLDLHKNVYPHVTQDENVIFAKFTHEEKKIVDKIIEKFCENTNTTPPYFSPKNGFSFYIFEKQKTVLACNEEVVSPPETSSPSQENSYIPQLLGLLRSYPSLYNATFNYGKKRL
jgi:hypothetical protein